MSRSRVYSTQAIILRRVDMGEADRLLTILTPARGKMKVMAKGVRKLTSRKTGHVELFTRVQFVLAQGHTFDVASQADTIEPYVRLREDVQRATLAHYVCELADGFAQEETDESELYELLAHALEWLCTAPDPLLVARYVEMRLLTLSGYRPQLYRCAKTSAPIEVANNDNKSIIFSAYSGGVLSPDAAKFARDGVALMPQTLNLLRAMLSQPFEALAALPIPADVHFQAERALRSVLVFVLERKLRSTQFLKQLV
ncbi:MAG: DNA repair protein RecO [Anaerolineae bacterium]|nr:DNA repair protein RecO [Anaerolineae bacterium]